MDDAATSPATMFTSGLSVNEFALLSQLGPEPLSQVMGSSVVQTGYQFLPALPPGLTTIAVNPRYGPSATGAQLDNLYGEASPSSVRAWAWHRELVCELDTLTDAWNLARRQALARLIEEARSAGADAVVGVSLQRSDHDLGHGAIEFVVNGTAIADRGLPASDTPLLTDLAVQDYWRLRQAGHRPVGLLASTAVVFASPSRSTRLQRLRAPAVNRELVELSRGVHAARALIRSHLAGQTAAAHANGAVGVVMTHSVSHERLALASSLSTPEQRGWGRNSIGLPTYSSGATDTHRGGWVITMHGAGTAIVYDRTAPPTVKTQIRVGAR
jgi:hypothetical protein